MRALWYSVASRPRRTIAFAHPACQRTSHDAARSQGCPRLGFVRLCLYLRERLPWRESIWAVAHRSIHHDPIGLLCTSSRIDAHSSFQRVEVKKDSQGRSGKQGRAEANSGQFVTLIMGLCLTIGLFYQLL